MREYDDDIRPYVPVLQRLIILVAVIVAVPVVLWTITTFIRTYIGPPHAPNYQRIAVLQPANSAADSSPVGTPQDITPASAAAPAADQTPAPSPPARLTTAPAAPEQTAAISQAPNQAPSQMAPAPPPVAVASAPASAAPLAAPPMAWEGSVMMPPARTTWDSPAIAAAPDQTAADDDALPAVAPIAGHVPLPRRRPRLVAMVQTSALQPTMAANNAVPTGVPLPRARPAAAPEAATPTETTNDTPTFSLEQAH
ncbi:MAG TPA: hypothetical protein VGH13_04505 [Xanthobacteraceae bacterium]|jgi:hypothetical protein